MTFAKRADKYQQEIANAFRGRGASVESLHRAGRGIPDLLVGYAGRTSLVEVKSDRSVTHKPKNQPFTPDQIRFRSEWRGEIPFTCITFEDVAAILATMKAREEPCSPSASTPSDTASTRS